MINASGKINSVAQKRTQTDWDLSSSITGTVKRRPSSLESCKSSSPTDSSDFPNDAPLKSESPSIKKRILKLPESARKSISTKLKLPNSRNKLSLAQLEQKNNLFIRDGQQRVKNSEENSNESQMMANNKKSLIPSFLNAKTNTKVQTKGNLAEKLTKTSHKFKEFCQHKEQQQSNVKKRPPPYRPPPTPPPSTANYEEIEVENDEAASAVAKAEMFQNIPVRQRKGNVSHMENYFLFDPSVDFCNEKDLGKKIPPKIPVEMKEEKLEDVTFDDQTIYDISEHDESKNLAHHNYYEIDPELLEKEEKKPKKIYSNTLSSSSESSTTATNSSSTTTSSSDYPSLFNSVIETTHSSTIESTDENDSNGYGKVEGKCENAADSSESVITVQNVTCGENNGTGAMKKKSPQLNRIIRQSNNNKQVQNFVRKTQFDPLKASHSLPQLQRSNGNKNEVNVVIDNSMAIQLRRPHNSRQLRPLSTHSDDRDSGFLSPATPPDCQNLQIVKSGDGRSKTESTLLNQCDNIQQMIEVSLGILFLTVFYEFENLGFFI